MGYNHANRDPEREITIQCAIEAISRLPFRSIRAIAAHFKVPRSTLQWRQAGKQSRTKAQEHNQLLPNAEDSALAKWVTRQAAIGYPITPALLKESA